MKQRRRRLKGATDLHLSLYTEVALPIRFPPLTVGGNGRRIRRCQRAACGYLSGAVGLQQHDRVKMKAAVR